MFRSLVIAALLACVAAEQVHWQWRELVCKGKDGKNDKEAAECSVQLKETENDETPRTVPLDTCFEETIDGKVRTYCSILCPGAATAYRITLVPQRHKSCFSHISYRLERRGENFYMWREGKCRTSDIAFTVRCEFSSARADFFSDEKLFDNERKVLAIR